MTLTTKVSPPTTAGSTSTPGLPTDKSKVAAVADAPAPKNTTPATPPLPAIPVGRFPIRQKGISRGLSAYASTKSERLTAKDGRQHTVLIGDMVLLQDGFVVDSMSREDFDRMWEVLPEGGLILRPDDQAAIEKACGFGSTKDSASLRIAIEKLARLQVGEITLGFTPAQWDDLNNRALKRGWKLDVYMKSVLDRWLQDLWTMSV